MGIEVKPQFVDECGEDAAYVGTVEQNAAEVRRQGLPVHSSTKLEGCGLICSETVFELMSTSTTGAPYASQDLTSSMQSLRMHESLRLHMSLCN